MTLHLHRSNRTEALVDALCRVLRAALPADPFEPFPIVVGSRGMERWLRHEIATRLEIAAGLAFPFPRQAIAGATRWLLDQAPERRTPFWDPPPGDDAAARWEPDAIALRLVGLLRARAAEPAFDAVTRYLGESPPEHPTVAVTAREILFTREVGDALDRLMHERPTHAIEWARDPAGAPAAHRWLATLLADLGTGTDPGSPAAVHQALLASRPIVTGRTMCVFGLSTMGPGDRERLVAIARSIEVHLFVLVPTDRWFRTQRTRREARAARRTAKSAAARQRTEAEIAADNPVLAALGAPSRDLQSWLELVDYRGDELEAVDPLAEGEPTLLHRLQSWILAAAGPDPAANRWPVEAHDSSIRAHSTYGALRQCEVLRDELLGLFAADPTLEPRDVVVMTPDIETFAPLLAAVFSRTGPARSEPAPAEATGPTLRLPRIPVAIADLGLRRTNPIAEVLLELLGVAGERLTASWVLDLVALDPVRRAFDLGDDDVRDVREMLCEAGLRWGLDAADRAAVGQPPSDQNTARFALERLALGVLMPDEGSLAVVSSPPGAEEGSLVPAVPVEVAGRERAHRVGRLLELMRAIAAHRRALREPATLDVWRTRLGAAIDDLTETSDKAIWLRAEVAGVLDDLARVGAQLGGLPVERAAVLRWLEARFEIAQRGDRPITGAVQVCALEPMRSVPFRVVALVGMDDGSFPRGGRPRTWDPMAERVQGERDRREIDRHLLLEAILSARERLLIVWSGHDVAQGRAEPAAVPVEELLEVLGGLTGRSRAELVIEHPLQPWSPTSFLPTPRSFDENMARAATELREIARGGRRPSKLGLGAGGSDPLPPEPPRTGALGLEELSSALLAPHRLLLRDRLGLGVDSFEPAVEDREPLELDELQAWSLRARLLEQLVARSAAEPDAALLESMQARLVGEGLAPPRAAGRAAVAREAGRATAVLWNAESVGGSHEGPLEIVVPLDPTRRLEGCAPDVRARGEARLLEWHTASHAPNEALLLRGWVHLLAAIAAGHPVSGARLVGYESGPSAQSAAGVFLAFDEGPAQALAMLTRLVDLWSLGRDRPLPLFRHTSAAIGRVLLAFDDNLAAPGVRSKLLEAVTRGWHGGSHCSGDRVDPWIATFFVDYDPRAELGDESPTGLLGLARSVWLPLHRGLARGQALGASWRSEVES